MNELAVVIIDVQVGLFATEPPPHDAAGVIDRINQLTRWARGNQVPVLFVQHEREHSPLARGAPGWALDPRLDRTPEDRVIAKTTPDSFHRTALQAELDALGVRRLIVGGFASEFCVDTTVRRAGALGYHVTLIADGHTTHDKPHLPGAVISRHHNATLCDITSFGVRIEALPAAELVRDRSAPPTGATRSASGR